MSGEGFAWEWKRQARGRCQALTALTGLTWGLPTPTGPGSAWPGGVLVFSWAVLVEHPALGRQLWAHGLARPVCMALPGHAWS